MEYREIQREGKMKEDLKREIELNGLSCECGGTVYRTGTGAIESQSNYNKYFEFIECPKCRKLFYL
jgi:uncharacterized protein with PIN domain